MNLEQTTFQVNENINLIEKKEDKESQIETSIEKNYSVSEYEERKERVEKEIHTVQEQIKNIITQLQEVRQNLGLSESQQSDPSIDALKQKEQLLIQERIKVSANYPGDWTLLLRDRMFDPITKQKFIETRELVMPNMRPGEVPPKPTDGISLAKEKEYQKHYQNQIDNYDANVEKIFSSTDIRKSSEFGKNPENLGKGEIGFEGAVFSDAKKRDGIELSIREKNIIEAHEKGHGLRDFVSEDQRDFRQSIDLDLVRQRENQTGVREIGYLKIADEIAERMAQLKNYFGLKARDIFTKEHLEYAKKNYLKDIKIDNNMTTFFEAITDFTRDKFIETINKYPL